MKPIQGGGLLQTWCSPDREYNHLFVKLNLDCEPDNYPGIVIVSNPSHTQVHLSEVRNLSRELEGLLEQFGDEPVVYWDLETDEAKRNLILAKLTRFPEFIG